MRTWWVGAVVVGAALAASQPARAQYNDCAGENRIQQRDGQGRLVRDAQGRTQDAEVARDGHGNANGNEFDLARDGAFEGQTVAVLHLYTGEGFDFSLPRAALAEKGFSVYRWANAVPPVEELEQGLAKACQLWIISGATRQLTDAHLAVIRRFFDAGHGVYIWGDNEPYYADANAVAAALLGSSMSGDLYGARTVPVQAAPGAPGFLPGHLLTTGLEQLFEGITIATLQTPDTLTPLLYGSAGNLVTAVHDRDGKRAILDGGFTRLYCNWDTAGTARYVKNAAAWLANCERFGAAVTREQPATARLE